MRQTALPRLRQGSSCLTTLAWRVLRRSFCRCGNGKPLPMGLPASMHPEVLRGNWRAVDDGVGPEGVNSINSMNSMNGMDVGGGDGEDDQPPPPPPPPPPQRHARHPTPPLPPPPPLAEQGAAAAGRRTRRGGTLWWRCRSCVLPAELLDRAREACGGRSRSWRQVRRVMHGEKVGKFGGYRESTLPEFHLPVANFGGGHLNPTESSPGRVRAWRCGTKRTATTTRSSTFRASPLVAGMRPPQARHRPSPKCGPTAVQGDDFGEVSRHSSGAA